MSALDPNAVVTVTVSTIIAPAPNDYQQSGAMVSCGGTNLAPQTTAVLTVFEDLESIIAAGMGITDAVWDAGDPVGPPIVAPFVTVTTVNPLPADLAVNDMVSITQTGFFPEAYNGIFIATVTGPNEYTYPAAIDPGAVVTKGQAQTTSSVNLNAMAATFFRQGAGQDVTVLELGLQQSVAEEISALETWLNNNTMSFYGYLLPYAWGNQNNIPTFLTLAEQFEYPEAMTYFWLTLTTPAVVGMIPPTAKCVIQLLEAPSVIAERISTLPGDYAEFTMAGVFFWGITFRATAITRVAPMCFKYIYGVTPYPLQNNGPLLLEMKKSFVNYIQTGAEGGINFTDVYQGVTADGFDYFNWWWTLDWVQLNINRDLTNAIINGSNNPLAPLYYDQPGINYIEAVLAGTMTRGAQFGMVNGVVVQTGLDSPNLAAAIQAGTYAGQCNVNAVPFIPYSLENPSDYGTGEYDGLSTLFIPARGFVHILVQVVATDIVGL